MGSINNISFTVQTEDLDFGDALAEVYAAASSKRALVFSSGVDFPGRHARWDLGFHSPAFEVLGFPEQLELNALCPRGAELISRISELLESSIQQPKLEQTTGSNSALRIGLKLEQKTPAILLQAILQTLSLNANDSLESPPFGFFGAFSSAYFSGSETGEQPLFQLYFPLELIRQDRKKEIAHRFRFSFDKQTLSADTQYDSQSNPPADTTDTNLKTLVARVLEATQRDELSLGCISTKVVADRTETPIEIFQRLSQKLPSPYLFFLNFGESSLMGSSPEILLRVDGTQIESCPIAGSYPRGETPLEEADQVRSLLSAPREEVFRTLVADDVRNTFALVCKPADVHIFRHREIEVHPEAIHTLTHITGRLSSEKNSFDALDLWKTPISVSGEPRKESRALTPGPNGWFSGGVGYISLSGDINLGLILRSVETDKTRAIARTLTQVLPDDTADEIEASIELQENFWRAFLYADEEVLTKRTFQGGTPLLTKPKLLFVDCKDSFVHNLAAYFRELGAHIETVRAGFPYELLDSFSPQLVFLSPGPGTPLEFGVPPLVGELVRRNMPVFGVCLGHQGIGQHFGAELLQLPIPHHGKCSQIVHNGNWMFEGITSPFPAGRYHSLYLKAASMPECLSVTAHWLRSVESGESEVIPMALEHRSLPIAAVQFHPESLMTLQQRAGHKILQNVLRKFTA